MCLPFLVLVALSGLFVTGKWLGAWRMLVDWGRVILIMVSAALLISACIKLSQ